MKKKLNVKKTTEQSTRVNKCPKKLEKILRVHRRIRKFINDELSRKEELNLSPHRVLELNLELKKLDSYPIPMRFYKKSTKKFYKRPTKRVYRKK